jgi:hypothetical protein
MTEGEEKTAKEKLIDFILKLTDEETEKIMAFLRNK